MKKRRVYLLVTGAALVAAGWSFWKIQPAAAQTEELVFATIYGPATILPGMSVKGCTNNLFGASLVEFRVTLHDAVSGAMVGSPNQLRAAPGRGVCFQSNPNEAGAPQSLIIVFSVPAASALAWGNDKKVV